MHLSQLLKLPHVLYTFFWNKRRVMRSKTWYTSPSVESDMWCDLRRSFNGFVFLIIFFLLTNLYNYKKNAAGIRCSVPSSLYVHHNYSHICWKLFSLHSILLLQQQQHQFVFVMWSSMVAFIFIYFFFFFQNRK